MFEERIGDSVGLEVEPLDLSEKSEKFLFLADEEGNPIPMLFAQVEQALATFLNN